MYSSCSATIISGFKILTDKWFGVDKTRLGVPKYAFNYSVYGFGCLGGVRLIDEFIVEKSKVSWVK